MNLVGSECEDLELTHIKQIIPINIGELVSCLFLKHGTRGEEWKMAKVPEAFL